MLVLAVRRWQWMLIGVVLGLALGTARESASRFSDELSSYGSRRLGQPEFERALVTKLAGQSQFRDLLVYPYRLGGASGGMVQLHVVAGLFWDGRAQEENGQLAARWEPAYFVASSPYHSLGQPQGDGKPRGEGAQFANVLDYLASLNSQGVQYTYARWWWASRPWFTWTAGGFALIGIIWPTIVNLLTYGTLLRPRKEAGFSIFSSGSASQSATPPAPLPQVDLAALDALDRQLQTGVAPDAAPTAAAVPPAAPAALSIAADAPRLEPAAAQKKDFGEERGGFYPTELHAKHEQ